MSNEELTIEEKARRMHAIYQRRWREKNPEKARQSVIKSQAKAYDRLMAEMAEAEAASEGAGSAERGDAV